MQSLRSRAAAQGQVVRFLTVERRVFVQPNAQAMTAERVTWLLEHADTDAFNALLQVCRPRTEDPLLLKAIASLVHVRTILLDLLYIDSEAYFQIVSIIFYKGKVFDFIKQGKLQQKRAIQAQ